jgi:ABC-2 type transport system ATP-binding protein
METLARHDTDASRPGDEGSAPALRLAGLHKVFADNVAVDHVDLTVPRGSFFGLVGPNGAGKTTALSMAVGLLRPDEGRSEVFGVDVWSDPVQAKAIMGVLPDGLAMPERLTGRELLTFIGQLRGIADDVVAQRTQELLDVMELNDAERTLVVDYSTGMRKKIGLAAALLHNPKVLFLDEPFEGVDPVSANTLVEVLQRYTASGSTVIFSSHVMELVERLCDWVSVMNRGQIVAQGPLETVRAGRSLNEAFLGLVGVRDGGGEEGLSWLGATSK